MAGNALLLDLILLQGSKKESMLPAQGSEEPLLWWVKSSCFETKAALGLTFGLCGAQSSWHRLCCFRYLQPGLGLLPDLQQAPNHPAEFWVIAGMAVQAVDWEHLFCTLAGAAACLPMPKDAAGGGVRPELPPGRDGHLDIAVACL